MSEYELSNLIFGLFRDMDSMVEFWITATLAIVAAVFLGRRHLSPRMLGVLAAIYLVVSVQWTLRWILLLRRTMHYRDELVRLGHPDIPTDWLLVGVITALLAGMVVLGVYAVLLFISRGRASVDGEQPEHHVNR